MNIRKSYVAAIVSAVCVCGGGLGCSESSPSSPSATATITAATSTNQSSPFEINWDYNQETQTWQASGIPPSCPTPLTLTTPVNLSRVTSILYPGQTRGGWFKPHGGFRFDAPDETGDIIVVAPMAATVWRASRGLWGENKEIQYMFDFINACGILYRLGHLRELSPRFQQIAESLPPAVEGDSRTTPVAAGQHVSPGETIGTAVGFLAYQNNEENFSLDWGVYDLRERNDASANPAWLAQHPGEFPAYAICWFDYLSLADQAIVRSLPPADGQSGTTSDYCH